MGKTDFRDVSGALPETWRSKIAGHAAGANVKVLRMDELASGEKLHGYEGLLVLDGGLRLGIGGEIITVSAADLCIATANATHEVADGGHGALVIIDQDE